MDQGLSVADFEALYRKYYQRVLGNLFMRVQDLDLAHDLAQEAFTNAFRERAAFNPGKSAASTWLYMVVGNTLSEWMRHSRRGERWAHLKPEDHLNPSPTPQPDARLIQRQMNREMIRLLGRLPENQKRVLWYKVISELSEVEIAERMGVTVKAVKGLRSRAMDALKEEAEAQT